MTLKQKYNWASEYLYHLVFRVDPGHDAQSRVDHLDHCPLCRKRFEKWKAEKFPEKPDV